MKWETIKNKAVTLSYEQFKKIALYEPSKVQLLLMKMHLNGSAAKIKANNPNFSIGDNLKMELWEQIKLAIDNWDIRLWQDLKELYPKAFPSGNLTPDFTDNGWELI